MLAFLLLNPDSEIMFKDLVHNGIYNYLIVVHFYCLCTFLFNDVNGL